MTSHLFKTIILIVLAQLSLQWCLKTTYNEIGSEILQVDWSPDGQYIVTGSKSQRVTVISVYQSNVVWFDTLSNDVTTAKFSKTGKWLGVGQMGSDTIRIYNVPQFTLNMSFSAEHSSSTTDIFELDFNSDDSKMITCGSDGYVNQRILTNSATSSIDWKGLIVNGKDVLTCKYSTTNRVGCFCDKQMYLLKTDGTIDKHKAKDIIRDVDFRPGGEQYLYGGCTCDHHLKEYDTVANGITDYFNTKDFIYAVSFAPDSTFLVTGGKAGHVYIYNTKNVNAPVQEAYFQQQNININSVRVSDDSNFVAVSKVSGEIDIYARNCMICPHGYYNNQSACRMCVLDINQCASCQNSTLCYFCFSGYYLNPTNTSQCIICRNAMVGCLLCKSDTVCLDCTQGYYLAGSSCQTCASVTPLCEQCLNDATCIKCSYISYLSSPNTCSLCSVAIPNCRACSYQYNISSSTNSTLYCRQCTRGYYASQVQCLPCSSNCIMCANTGTCLACAQQYKLSGITCVKCNQYCEGCNESGACYQCIPTAFLSSGSCSLCTFPCLTCATTATSCRTCALGYYYLSLSNTCTRCVNCPFCDPISGACISCPIGKYLQSNTCLNCLNTTSHCAICNETACLACERNFYLTGTNTCAVSASISDCQIYQKSSTSICDHCFLGFYLDTTVGTCFKCMTSCSLCDNPNNCTQCQIGYYLISANLTCAPCTDPCKTCNSSIECLSCGQEYYLSGTQCLKCWVQIPFCNSCMNSTHCLDCYVGYQVASNSLSCIPCASPCTSCNSSGCLSCQLGYFYSSNACTRCPVGCTSCTSLTNCLQCLPTFVGNGSVCASCQSLFSNCLTCSLVGCITCKPYFSLNSLGVCSSCSINITNCLSCYNGLCETCITGNHPASDRLSCVSCSATMPECQKCVNGSTCDECRSGFYLSAVNQCSKCANGCRICTNSLTCDICDTGFILNASVCISCSQQVLGCKMCTFLGGCYQCSIEYYLASTTSCLLCRSAMIGCISCISSTTCSSCDSGYFLNSSSKCQPCNIFGCSVCNQSTAACSECITGFYLASPILCQVCSTTYSNCDVCNTSQCLRCESGTYLTSLNSCSSCTTFGQSCIFCNNTHCLQCEAGFYLRPSDSSCQICSLTGCQVCSPDGVSCLSCQNTYFLANSLCSPCYTMDFGCVSCSGLNSCLLCKTGYFLQSNGTCVLCSSRFFGCQICTGLACESCQTNYFQNLSSISKNCLMCNSFMRGCQLCIDQNQCLVCESGYYLQNSQCISCTILNQCLICKDNSTCIFCTEGYYLQNGQCLSCSSAMLGCFSCLSSTVCVTCGGSYMLTPAGICQMIKATPPRNYTEIKVKSYYVNETHLKHTIYLKGIEFTRIDQQWSSVTTIEAITPPNNKAKLTILAVNWGKVIPLTTLDFYTNNPFGSFSNNNNMPFYSFSGKRVLFSLDELNMAVNLQIKRAALDQILPDLDTNMQDLSLQYFMDEPQFYKSLVRNQRNYYYLFGIAVTAILIFAYFIKIMCLSSFTSDAGEIIPHILLNKVCAMIIYPTLGGYINYCEGFTYIDFPWLNTYFSQLLSNLSDESPNSYKMFYNNLNIASTYLLACIVFIVAFVPLYILTVYKNRNRMQGGKRMIKPRREDSSNGSENSDEKQFQKSINRFQLLTQYLYNIFSAGLIFASFTNLLGMLMNPTNIISVSGVFYILGTFIFVFTFLNAVKSFLTDKIKFNRLRVIIKASFMALMYWSPILLFSALVVVEIAMIMIQYKIKTKQWLVPKAWIVCNILNLMSYASLIFLSNMILGLIISSGSIILMLIIDGYLIYAQSQQSDKIKKMRSVRLDSSIMNFTIEQFDPDKSQSKLQDIRNIYFDENEKGMSKIRSGSTTSFQQSQVKESKISKTTLSKIEEEISKRSNIQSPNRKGLSHHLESEN